MKAQSLALVLVLLIAGFSQAEPLGTGFTYQGELKQLGAPANGPFDFRFEIFEVDIDGMAIAGPVLLENVEVANGVFTVELDFGPTPFAGDQLWLEIGVSADASAAGYTPLLPRQKVTAVPYALHAEFVAPGSVSDQEIDSSTVQVRVSGSCSAGESIRVVDASGGVVCEADNDTQYTAGDGIGLAQGEFHLDASSCQAGEVLKRDSANGAWECVAVTAPNDLNDVSNNLLTNEFDEVVCGDVFLVVPDGNLAGVSDTLTFPDVGVAQVLTVQVNFGNPSLNNTRVSLTDPLGVEAVLWCGQDVVLWETCFGDTTATSINTSYPDITAPHFGNLQTWVGNNPTGNWTLRAIDQAADGTDGEITSWCMTLNYISNSRVEASGDLVVSGSVQVGQDSKPCSAANEGGLRYDQLDGLEVCDGVNWASINRHKEATYRWAKFNTYDDSLELGGWALGNDPAFFGGVAPSAWTDGNAIAASMSADKEVLRTLFTRKGYATANATIANDVYHAFSSTDGLVTMALFRIRNTTASPINWQPNFHYSAYGTWGERASVALNGISFMNANASGTTTLTLPIPPNRVSTAIFVSTSGLFNANSRVSRLAFGNNSLSLPAGLEFVDDLDTASGGWEQ